MIRTLIVDDDVMVADANRSYLESVTGFECVGVAHQSKDVFGVLETYQVDLVLLDIFMPGQSGIELLQELRKSMSGVDVIVISAASDMSNIKTALRLGAIDYLIKPFEFERFHAALRAYETEHRYMTKQEVLSQAELDAVFLHQDKSEPGELPKGLTQATLKTLVDEMMAETFETVTAESLSQRVGISRVTVGKYLRFLTDIGFLASQLEYRSIGRPVYHYHINRSRRSAALHYIEGIRT